MAYENFDPYGNYIGGYGLTEETEEERRRRLANELVGKTEVQTYADGSQTRKITQEIPAAGPVAPDDTYQRMIQAESGGQDFDAQGRPLTSPAGAMYRAQVMPQTAAQPGFGVRPAANQSPEEYNRVGREYYEALLRRYGGDQAKAAAAYNAGPGTVDRNIQANQGQMNVGQLPNETQGYLDKVLGGVKRGTQAVLNTVIPSAQAAQSVDPAEERRRRALAQRPPLPQAQPAAPAAPQAAAPTAAAAPTTPTATAAPLGQGLQVPGLATTPFAPPSTSSIDLYQQSQDNPEALMRIRGDETQPAWVRERAGVRAYEILDSDMKKRQAEAQAQQLVQAAAQGDRKASMTMAKELQNQEGSYLKMILLGFLSPELAGDEAIKLGFGNKWETIYDATGNPALVQKNARGLPLKGYKADGTAMDQSELIAYAGGKRDLDIVGGSYVNDRTGEVGRLVTDKKTGQSYIQTDTGRKTMTGFRPQASTGTLADMRARAIQDINLKLQGKGIEEQMAILRDYNKMLVGQGYAPVQPGEVGISVPQIGKAPTVSAPAPGTAPAPAAPAITAPGAVAGPVAPAPAPVTPAPAPGAAPAAPGRRPSQSELAAQAEAAKEAAQVTGKDIGTVRANQGKSESTADYVITKVNELITHPGFTKSVGVFDVGGIPVPFGATAMGMIPGSDVSDWRARFEEVKGQSFLTAIENLKGMGALSDREGAAAQQAIQRMRESQSEKEFRAAAQDFQEVIQRGIDRNRVKLGQESKYGTPPESQGQSQSPADKARAELERRRKQR